MSLSDRDFVMRRARQLLIRRIVREKASTIVASRTPTTTPYGPRRQTRTKSSTETSKPVRQTGCEMT